MSEVERHKALYEDALPHFKNQSRIDFDGQVTELVENVNYFLVNYSPPTELHR